MTSVAGLYLVAVLGSTQATESVPQEVLDEMQFLVGSWEVESTVDGETQKGIYRAEWGPGRRFLFLHFNVGDLRGSAISGWDPRTNELVETWYGLRGEHAVFRYKIESDNKWVGTVTKCDATGEEVKGKISVTKDGRNKFVFSETSDRRVVNTNVRIVEPANYERIKQLAPFIGTWSAEHPNGDKTTWSFVWGANKNSIQNTIERRDSSGKLLWSNDGCIVWNAANEKIVNFCFNERGRPVNFVWIKSGDKSWKTGYLNTEPTWSVKLTDENVWSMVADGDVSTFHRVDSSD